MNSKFKQVKVGQLVRIYQMMRTNKRKIWVASDFSLSTGGKKSKASDCLLTLCKLNLIEDVLTYVEIGYNTRKKIQGWRIK